MTIQPYKRLRLVPANTPEGRRIAREIGEQGKAHQRRAKAAKPSRTVPELTRWHTI